MIIWFVAYTNPILLCYFPFPCYDQNRPAAHFRSCPISFSIYFACRTHMNVTKGAERRQTHTIEESDGLRLKLTLSSLEQSFSQYYLKHTKHRERGVFARVSGETYQTQGVRRGEGQETALVLSLSFWSCIIHSLAL